MRWSLALSRWRAARLRDLYLAADDPRERADLVRFAFGHVLTRRFSGGDAVVYLNGTAHVVGRDTEEIYILNEIYVDRHYDRRPDFIPQPGWTVVDIGAHVGVFAARQARRGAHVYAFEPNPDCYRRLRRTIAANGLDHKVHTFPVAVGAAAGTGTMKVPAGWTQSGKVVVGASSDAAPSVAIIALDDIIPTLDISRIDLLKIDVEGAEVEVLRGATQTLPMVARVVLEYHTLDLLGGSEVLLQGCAFAPVLRVDLVGEQGIIYCERILDP